MNLDLLAELEQDWKSCYANPDEGFKDLAAHLRKSWENFDTIVAENAALRLHISNNPEIIPMDHIERNALKMDSADKQKKIIELMHDAEALKEEVTQLTTNSRDLRKKIDLDDNALLSYYLAKLNEKFRKSFDDALELRREGKVSEYTMTLLTSAHECAYLCEKLYEAAMKEDAKLLERPAETKYTELKLVGTPTSPVSN
jgi:hypothetical protein